MPEKAANSSPSPHPWPVPVNPMIHWSVKVLTLSVFLGILIVWGIDGWNLNGLQKDFLTLRLNTPDNLPLATSQIFTQIHQNLVPIAEPLPPNRQNLTQTLETLSPKVVKEEEEQTVASLSSQDQNQLNFTNFTSQIDENLEKNPIPTTLDWISASLGPNYSSNLLSKWLAPSGEPCKASRTVEVSIPKLDGKKQIELPTGEIHEFVFQALDDSGKPHCLGGDYFELDLSGDSWKSRPPLKDLGNGSYSFSLQVHQDFPGKYNLTLILLFRHYEGLKFSPERFAFDRTLRVIPIHFAASSARLPEIAQCKRSDFSRDVWSGRWTRHGKNESCSISNDGRYRCLERSFPCKRPWCFGSLGSLESNGWTYSAHCSFRLFSTKSAWECLSNRWIFFWGDSNHCDTVRNILHFILDVPEITTVPRLFDMNITNPRNPSQVVRITSIFNGHHNHTGNYQGLNSLTDDAYREKLRGYFSGKIVPDTVIMNSGLHDGVFWPNLRRFVKGAEFAAKFWGEVMEGVRQRGVAVPEVVFRTTVATGGYARRLAFNPDKIEAFNGVILDKFRQLGIITTVVDHFDMTFPWHFDNRCNDGVHYGRAPAKMKWRDGEIGHQYFVDLMLGHVLLNVLCAR